MSDVMQPTPNNGLAKGSMILGIAGIAVFIIAIVLMFMGINSFDVGMLMISGIMFWVAVIIGIVGLILGIVASNQGAGKAGLIINAVFLGLVLVLWILGKMGGA